MPWYDDVVMPALLDSARRGYGAAMRAALEEAGFDDMPRVGMRMLGGIARNGPAGPDLAGQLGIRHERAERLATVLMERGYVERSGEQYVLTERGKAAAAAAAQGGDAFQQQILERVGLDALDQMRETLAAIIELSDPHFADG